MKTILNRERCTRTAENTIISALDDNKAEEVSGRPEALRMPMAIISPIKVGSTFNTTRKPSSAPLTNAPKISVWLQRPYPTI